MSEWVNLFPPPHCSSQGKGFNHLPLWAVRDYYNFSLYILERGFHTHTYPSRHCHLHLISLEPKSFWFLSDPCSTLRSHRMHLLYPNLFQTLRQKGIKHGSCPSGSYRLIFKQWVQSHLSWQPSRRLWGERLGFWRVFGEGMLSGDSSVGWSVVGIVKELLYPHPQSPWLTVPPSLSFSVYRGNLLGCSRHHASLSLNASVYLS